MKKTLILTVSASILLAACSPKDQAYYDANIKDAEAKTKSCEQQAKQALEDRDIESVQKHMEDPECKAATTAYKKHLSAQRELERKMAEEKRQAERQALREKLMAKYTDMPWRDFFTAYNSPDFRSGYSAFDEGYKIQNEILKIKQDHARREINRIEYIALLEQEESYCQKDRRPVSACTIYHEVLKTQKTGIIERFKTNYEDLKKVFNQCHASVESLRKAGEYTKSNEIARSYPCDLAMKAASQLRLAYNYKAALK